MFEGRIVSWLDGAALKLTDGLGPLEKGTKRGVITELLLVVRSSKLMV